MKVAFILPISWEFAYPQSRDNFDVEVMCGSEAFEMKYPRVVKELGVEPVLFYLSQYGKSKKDLMHKHGFRLRRIPVHFGAGHSEKEFSTTLFRELSKEKFDLFHWYNYYRHWRYPDAYDFFALYCKVLGYRFVAQYQASEFPGTHTNIYLKKKLMGMKRLIKRLSINAAQRIFCITRLEIDRLTNRSHPKYYGIPFAREKFVYLPNVVDTASFFPSDKANAIRKLNLDPTKKYILYVGYLREAKGVQHMINIIPRLKGYYPNLQLLLVGEDGGYEMALRCLVRKLKIQHEVSFVGQVLNQKLRLYYNAADVHILPSYTEGMPTVVLEALACNAISVGTTVGGIPELLSDGVGLLVPPKDEEMLFEAIKKVLDDNLEIDSNKRAEKLYEHSYQNVGNILLRTYKQILGES
jgi:glycosyltransferase involved in cell wall biosynthesis